MKRQTLLLLAAAVPAMAELPPAVPSGPVEYDSLSYQPDNGGYTTDYTDPYDVPAAAAPITPAAGNSHSASLNLNLYSSDYQVRGMGVRNYMSHKGYSSVDGSYTFPNRNILNRGLQCRVAGTLGSIWGRSEALGDIPVMQGYASIGKEIFPNLTAELGYTARRGGLEGYMAHYHNGAPHRFAHDIDLSLTFDDHQRGLFGHALVGHGFQGLNGSFADAEAGYRFTDVAPNAAIGADVEVSFGISASCGYWGHDVNGVDAYRIRVAAEPFTHGGWLGRDSHFYIKPWVQTSWSGNTARKIDRLTGYDPIDRFQITVGVDAELRF